MPRINNWPPPQKPMIEAFKRCTDVELEERIALFEAKIAEQSTGKRRFDATYQALLLMLNERNERLWQLRHAHRMG